MQKILVGLIGTFGLRAGDVLCRETEPVIREERERRVNRQEDTKLQTTSYAKPEFDIIQPRM